MLPTPLADESDAPSGYVAVPRYNVEASAGMGSLIDNGQIVEYLAFSDEFIHKVLHAQPSNLLVIQAKGESMEPGIRDGDILPVDIRPDQAIEHGRVYVVVVEEELVVKRLMRRMDGSVVISSDNARYPQEVVARRDLERLHILGRVLLISAPPR